MVAVRDDPTGTQDQNGKLWILLGLLILEGLALGLTTPDAPLPMTRFSVTVAVFVLLTGFLPTLLRPTQENVLAACLATLMASLLVVPFDRSMLPKVTPEILLTSLPGFLLVRLVNGAAIAPLAVHLSARFPRRLPPTARSAPSDRQLAGLYGMSFALLVALLTASTRGQRTLFFLLLVGWVFGLLAVAIGQLIRRAQDPDPEHRRAAQQARLLLYSIALAETPWFVRAVSLLLGSDSVPYNLVLAAQVFIPLGVAYTVLRHDLFGIDAALRRALAYATLSLVLLAVYFGLTVALTAILARAWSQFSMLAALIGLFTAAAAFEPLRRRIQRLIDRALYPERLTFQRELEAAQATLAGVLRREDVIALLTQRLPQRLGAAWATLSLAPAPEVPGPATTAPAWNAQLIVGGTPLGRYWLGPRRTCPSYDAEEQAQLQGLTQQAALALAYADAFDALTALNRELEQRVAERTAQVLEQQRTLAVFEERQRLARDLHDSVTQTLFSISLSARAIRALLRQDVGAASERLLEQEAAAQRALAEMRALLTQLRGEGEEPVGSSFLTGDGNLARALALHCALLEREVGLAVTLNVPTSLRQLPMSLSNELLHIAKEALHNVVKHSDATEATCTLAHERATLVLTVADRGKGFDLHGLPTPSAAGYGLRGMRERVSVLGGSLEIRTQRGGGTVVKVRVPYKCRSETISATEMA